MEGSTRKQIPLKEGMISLPSSPGEEAYLIGSRCCSCGDVFFIKRDYCLNCQSSDLEEVALNRRGKLWGFTVMFYPAPPPYKPPDPFVPYGVGWVELPDGVMVHSVLTASNPGQLHVGMDMELVIEKLDGDEEGNDIMTYKFHPVPGT